MTLSQFWGFDRVLVTLFFEKLPISGQFGWPVLLAKAWDSEQMVRGDFTHSLHIRNWHCQQLQFGLFKCICRSGNVRPLHPGPSQQASFPRNNQTQMSPSEKAISKETWTRFTVCPGYRAAADLLWSWRRDTWYLVYSGHSISWLWKRLLAVSINGF